METQTQTQTGLGQILAGQIGTTDWVIGKNLEGIGHSDSLTHPDQGGSNLNWVVGHICDSRNKLATALTGTPLFDPARFAAYEGKTDSGFSDEQAVDFAELASCCEEAGQVLMAALGGMDDAALAQPAPFSVLDNPDETMGSLAATFTFHDAYHAGQTGVLRRVCGLEGVLTPPDLDV